MLNNACTKLRSHYTSVHGLSDTANSQTGENIMTNLTFGEKIELAFNDTLCTCKAFYPPSIMQGFSLACVK